MRPNYFYTNQRQFALFRIDLAKIMWPDLTKFVLFGYKITIDFRPATTSTGARPPHIPAVCQGRPPCPRSNWCPRGSGLQPRLPSTPQRRPYMKFCIKFWKKIIQNSSPQNSFFIWIQKIAFALSRVNRLEKWLDYGRCCRETSGFARYFV
jgi:hypothetical protein